MSYEMQAIEHSPWDVMSNIPNNKCQLLFLINNNSITIM